MRNRAAIAACLVFSGLTALVYQIIWTRLLGFAFGTTTEAIGTVLAVFFGGLALGNALAARGLERVARPLRVYGWLELGIGVFALLSLPLLRGLPGLHAWLGVGHGALASALVRFAAAALVLLPPTMAMGATLPVVARALVSEDGSRGRWSALLYAANTGGAVLGAYLCGFWLIPELGLARSVIGAGLVNLAVAAAVLLWVRGPRAPAPTRAAPAASAGASGAGIFLICFAASGFVAIGYEVIWSKLFAIVMEGTLYGFAAVLSAYLLGIALGSAAMAPFVDRIRDLPRAFALLHLATAASVAAGMAAVPWLPFAQQRLTAAWGGDALHPLFALVVPIVLLPTALFGAAFPVLIRIYAPTAAAVGRGVGLATAVNTAGSIASSLLVGFWWIPRLGMDASLYALVMLDLGIALAALLAGQARTADAGPLVPARGRRGALAGSALVALWLALGFDGVQVERAVAGRQVRSGTLEEYARELARTTAAEALSIEGRTSVVTVYDLPAWRALRTNGLPEAGFHYAPPHYPLAAVLLGVLPYVSAEDPERALVIGLGGGNTLSTLLRTEVAQVEVVELEAGVARALDVLFEGRESPLADPRVRLLVNDGRNELLRAVHDPLRRWDLIASQPSHPWRVGAANLFTEEFFRLARRCLAPGGRFALWVNGFRTDPESLLAVTASFERVFPGALLFDLGEVHTRDALLLLGGREPIALDVERIEARATRPGLAALLAPHDLDSAAALLARVEGPAAAFAALAPDAANTDDNAFVETRIPRRAEWSSLDFASIESRLPADAPLLPPLRGAPDAAAVARALLAREAGSDGWPYAAKLERLLHQWGGRMDPVTRAVLRAAADLRSSEGEAAALATLRVLADAHPERPEPLRLLGEHLARERGEWAAAADAFAAAHARSGAARDAWDAARALHPLDPQRAWRWLERIPAERRADFPRLAFYAAQRALERGTRGEALRAHYDALVAFRDTEEGRTYPGVDALLERLARRLGDAPAARAWSDAEARQRAASAGALLARAEAALAGDRPDEAADALAAAHALLPTDERVATLRARLALARSDTDALRRALDDLRRWAPTLAAGIAAENRFRSRHALPLLPEHPPQP